MEFTNFPTLSRSPLVETVACVTLKGTSVTREQILSWAREYAPDYDEHEDIGSISMTMDVRNPGAVHQTNGWIGMRLRNKSNLVAVLQNEPDGSITFASSMLNPYSKWDEFKKLSLPLIESVYNLIKASSVIRLGVRSIDRIAVDVDRARLSDILTTVPPDVDGVQMPIVHDFLYKDTAFYGEFGLFATVIRAGQPNVSGTGGAVILDIDVFHMMEQGVDLRTALAKLPEIRELKNRLFFNTVSKEWLERFK